MKTKAISTIMLALFLLSMMSMTLVIPVAASPSSVPITGWWHFDDFSGPHVDLGEGTIAKDSSGYDNDGTLENMNPFEDWVGGRIGRALDFDGVDDYVSIPSSLGDELDITSSFTLEAWIKYTGDAIEIYYPRIVEKSYADSYFFGLYYLDTTRLSVWIDGTEITEDSPGTVSPGEWHHVAAVFNDDTNEVKLYNDGDNVYSGSYTGSITGSDNDVLIGKYFGNAGGEFTGIIDEVRIWNVALTNEEISASYGIIGCIGEGDPTKTGVADLDPGMGRKLVFYTASFYGDWINGGWTKPSAASIYISRPDNVEVWIPETDSVTTRRITPRGDVTYDWNREHGGQVEITNIIPISAGTGPLNNRDPKSLHLNLHLTDGTNQYTVGINIQFLLLS